MNNPFAIFAIAIIANFRLLASCDYRISRFMDQFANNLIDALGGTSAVARDTCTPTSTVHSWRKNGIPTSRLAHIRLIAERDGRAVDWSTGLAIEGEGGGSDHVDTDTVDEGAASHGKTDEISTRARGGDAPARETHVGAPA